MIHKKPPIQALLLALVTIAIIGAIVYFNMTPPGKSNPIATGSLSSWATPSGITDTGAVSDTGSLSDTGAVDNSWALAQSGSTASTGEISEPIKLSPEEQKEIDRTMKEIDKLFDGIGK